MKFLCLSYLDEAAFTALPEDERSEILKECYSMGDSFRETGKVVAEEGLHRAGEAKAVRTRNGQRIITNGPFIETSEQIGSYFIVEADSFDEAVEVASLHPAAIMGEEYGFGIEIRQIQE